MRASRHHGGGGGGGARLLRRREAPAACAPRARRATGVGRGPSCAVVANGLDAIFSLARAGRGGHGAAGDEFVVTFVNERATTLFARSRAALLGRRLSELPFSDSAAPLARRVAEVMAGGHTLDDEFALHAGGGQLAPRYVRCQIVPDGAGVTIVARDMTDRWRADAELALLGVVVRSMAEGVALVREADATIVYANRKFERIHGYDPGELTGRPVEVLNFDTAADEARALIAEVGAWGEATREVRNVRKDGSPIWCRAHLSSFAHPEYGAIWVAVLDDITAQRAALGAVRQAEELRRWLAEVVEASDDAIVSVNAEGQIQTWNRGAERLFGMSRDQVVGRTATALATTAAGQTATAQLRRALAGERIEEFELAVPRSGGEPLEAMLSISPVRDPGGAIAGLLVVATDVSAHKRAERALRASLEEKEVLLKEIHHRVKNNLQVISSLLSLQASRLREPEQRHAFEESQLRVRSIALLHEMLYQREDLARVDMAGYLRSLTASLHATYQSRGAAVVTEVSGTGVVLQLAQAIPCGLLANELISNAFKHAFRGRPAGHIWVEIAAAADAAVVRLEVRDDGVGLPAGIEPHAAGSLGLQLVEMLARQLGATVAVERRGSDGGTRVAIEFAVEPPAYALTTEAPGAR